MPAGELHMTGAYKIIAVVAFLPACGSVPVELKSSTPQQYDARSVSEADEGVRVPNHIFWGAVITIVGLLGGGGVLGAKKIMDKQED